MPSVFHRQSGMSLRAGYRRISPPKRDLKAGWNFNRAQILEAYFNGVQSKIAGCVYLMSLPSFSLATSLYSNYEDFQIWSAFKSNENWTSNPLPLLGGGGDSHLWATRVCVIQQGKLFAFLEQGIKITLSLWKWVYFTLGLTLEQGWFFPESWLITIKYSYETPLHSLFALWLIIKITVLNTVYRYIFYILCVLCNRVANSSFFLWNRSRVSGTQSAAHPHTKF